MKKMKKHINLKFLASMFVAAVVLFSVGCDDDGAGWNDQRYLENYEIAWDNPNPATGLPYTEEELAALKYDPTKQERFKGEQAVVLSLLVSKPIEKITAMDGESGEIILTETNGVTEEDKYRVTFNTTLAELNIEYGTSRMFKFDITYTDKSIGSSYFKIVAPIPMPSAAEMVKAQWKFDDAADLTKATVGKDLVLAGNMIHQAIEGITAGDGAVLVDADTWYIAEHGLAASGGDMVNNYTIIFDMNIPEASYPYPTFLPLLQTSLSNSRDGAVYHTGGWFWTNGYGWSSWAVQKDTWHRVVITVAPGDCRIYLDNARVYGKSPSADGVFALDLAGFLLFADNNGEDAPIKISEVTLCDVTLTNEWAEEDIPAVGEPIP